MNSRRQQRVASHIRRILSEVIGAGARDPRIGFVSVMGVEVSPDLKSARVHVSVLGDEREKEKTLRGLESARGFIQRELAAQGGLRFTPHLSFHLDDTIDHTLNLNALLARLREEGQLPEAGDEDSPEADFPDRG